MRVHLQLLKQVEVLLTEALIGPLQLSSSLVLVEGWGRVQQFILQHVVLHLIGLELLGHIHLTNLTDKKVHTVRIQIFINFTKTKCLEDRI